MTNHSSYCCTEPGCSRARLTEGPDGMTCPNGHGFPFAAGTRVPVFASQPEGANEYSIKDAAEIHDNSLRWVFNTFQADEDDLRDRLISRIGLKRGQRVLITGAGAGNDLPYLAAALSGSGEIYAQDIAREMLLAGVSRHAQALTAMGVESHFSVSDATNLPFADGFFDAAYHFGGINLFPDIAAGISEMNRVVKSGGNIVIGDEGLAPWLVETEMGRMLINNNALYAYPAPLNAIPKTAREVKLSWELSNSFYVIEFQACTDPLPLDIDVLHLGKRGGTIRSRYFGRMEGVDPDLRDQVYREAERRGVSRVEILETALRASLDKD
ncbi:methyltransferase domain-containing protein [Labrenzia sp. DG1229]|uniref:methyltransferase domain-containing protein n=1 Tax=Labrenzia sp. DG1229 TaxID=681847 RepID=UPI000A0299DD|nr:methyltransferase domain-containing protein [Labrenzia sp. DG1229]